MARLPLVDPDDPGLDPTVEEVLAAYGGTALGLPNVISRPRQPPTKRIMELWATVGLSNQVNRFHATFLTDVDDTIIAALGTTSPLPDPAPAERGWARMSKAELRSLSNGLVFPESSTCCRLVETVVLLPSVGVATIMDNT